MLSRTNSTASNRSSPGRTPGKPKPSPGYVCKHELLNSRLNSVIATLPLGLKTRKCPDCQTALPESSLALLEAVKRCLAASAAAQGKENNNVVDALTRRKLAECLFERFAERRRGALKDRYDGICLSWATLCYLYVPAAELKDACQTIKAKFGAGVERQLLQTLGRAACVEENVFENFEPRDTPMFATVNHIVDDLRRRREQIDRFSHVEDVFFAARELGMLCDATVTAYNKVFLRFERWGSRK